MCLSQFAYGADPENVVKKQLRGVICALHVFAVKNANESA